MMPLGVSSIISREKKQNRIDAGHMPLGVSSIIPRKKKKKTELMRGTRYGERISRATRVEQNEGDPCRPVRYSSGKLKTV